MKLFSDVSRTGGANRRIIGSKTAAGPLLRQIPTAQFVAAVWAPGTPAHSRQSTACSGMSIGRKGLTLAAKTLALTVLDVVYDPKQVDLAREAFERRRGGQVYKSRVPADQKPPLNYRDKP